MRRAIGVYLLYVFAAVVLTYPLVTQLDTQLVGHAFSDSTEYTRHVWWMVNAVRTGAPLIEQPLLLYPDGIDGSLLWALPLQTLPAALLALPLPLPVAFNLAAILTLALNGVSMWLFSMWLFSRTLFSRTLFSRTLFSRTLFSRTLFSRTLFSGAGRGEAGAGQRALFPALVSGLIFMAYPAFQGQLALGHVGLLAVYPVPLLMLALARLRGGGALGWRLAAALLLAASGWGSALLLVYCAAPLVGAWLLLLVWRREWGALRRTLPPLIAGAALAGALALVGLRTPTSREGQSVQFSATPLNIVSPSYHHPLWGALDYPRAVLSVDPFEGAAYIGVIAGGLALVGALRRRAARFWLIPAAGAWILSWGALLQLSYNAPVSVEIGGYPSLVALPYALLERLPLLEIARTPVRFSFAIGFALAALAGWGAEVLFGRLPRYRAALALLLAAAILFDFQFFFPMPSHPAAIPAAVSALAAAQVRAVFNVPWSHPLTDKEGMYLQTAHQHPMIAGHIARRTLLNPAQGWLLETTLDPALLDAAGVDAIILHKDWDDPAGELDARLRAAFGQPDEDARFALFRVPPYGGAPPSFHAFAPPPTDSEAVLYVYLPQAGDYTLTGTMAGEVGRTVALLVDDEERLRWQIGAAGALRVPLALEAGYHTVRAAAVPPCPPLASAALRCAALRIEGLSLE